jgi:L-ascorbate metabolism protein UlaG (beta-lactamase superfamily)
MNNVCKTVGNVGVKIIRDSGGFVKNSSLSLLLCGVIGLPLGAMADSTDPTTINDPRFATPSVEAACNIVSMASTGGPTLQDPKTLAVRWLGYSTFELIYGNKVILLDNYYDRGPRYRYLGFKAADVKRADLIIVGHAHYDHMSDTAQVAIQTGAKVIGAPITIAKLRTQSVPESQLVQVTGTGGELLQYPALGINIEPILGRHGEPPAFTTAFGTAYTAAIPAPTPDEAAAETAIKNKGSTDAHIVDQGTIAYILTFDTGFRLAYRDSGGVMTSYETAAMQRYKRVDVLLGAIAANVIAESQADIWLPMLNNYQPDVVLPAHHEEEIGGKVDRATEPLFQYGLNVLPRSLMISKTFRQPTCFDTRRNIESGTSGT